MGAVDWQIRIDHSFDTKAVTLRKKLRITTTRADEYAC